MFQIINEVATLPRVHVTRLLALSYVEPSTYHAPSNPGTRYQYCKLLVSVIRLHAYYYAENVSRGCIRGVNSATILEPSNQDCHPSQNLSVLHVLLVLDLLS